MARLSGMCQHRVRAAVVAAVLINLVVAVAGCGASGGAAGSGGSGGSGGPAAPGGTSASADVPAATVTIDRSGGFAPVNDHIVIDGSGAWTATREGGATRAGKLPADRLLALRSLIDQAAASTAQPSAPEGTCADGYTYVVGIGGRTARTDDCALATQPALRAIITTVTEATGG